MFEEIWKPFNMFVNGIDLVNDNEEEQVVM